MTEKRFTLKYINEQHISANLYDCGTFVASIGIGAELIVELLNNLSEENDVLKQQLSEQGTQIDFLKDENTHMRNVLNENKQLKQRNNRQAKQLDRLYNLIEEKDWRTLTDILDDFKRCEEQLHKEWRTYGDLE